MSHGSDTLTGTHNNTSEVSPSAVRDPNVIGQHMPNGIISCSERWPKCRGPRRGGRRRWRVSCTLRPQVSRTCLVHTSTQWGKLATYIGGEGTRKTPFLSLTCAPDASGHMCRCAADDDRVKRDSVNPSSSAPLLH